MSHTFSSLRIHVIFSTKERKPILLEELQPKLWAYMAGIARNHKFEALKIGGTKDHCHALILLPPPIPLSKAVQTIKGCSSKWLNETGAVGASFAWQGGYASIQRERLADRLRDRIYSKPDGTSQEEKLWRGISRTSETIRGRLRPNTRAGIVGSSLRDSVS